MPIRRFAVLFATFGMLAHSGAVSADSETASDVIAVGLPLAALGMTLYEEDRDGRWQLAKSFGVSALTTLALKEAVDKERPDGDCCESFPSGHTSTAFVGATFIHRRYGLKRAWPAYLLATYVGYARVDADRHFTEDVLAGAAIGILSGWFLTSPFENTEFTPVVSRDYYGIQISGRFR